MPCVALNMKALLCGALKEKEAKNAILLAEESFRAH